VNNLTSILPENDALIQDEDELENLIKDYYSDDIFQHYTPSDEDEDDELF
jgi:predicted DNA binding CopG/RHH family protein